MIRTLRRLLRTVLAQRNPAYASYCKLRAEVQRQHGRTRDVDAARKKLTTEQLKRDLGRL
jgi:hypothetical protein